MPLLGVPRAVLGQPWAGETSGLQAGEQTPGIGAGPRDHRAPGSGSSLGWSVSSPLSAPAAVTNLYYVLQMPNTCPPTVHTTSFMKGELTVSILQIRKLIGSGNLPEMMG